MSSSPAPSQSSPAPRRRWVRWLFRLVFAFVVILIFLGVGAYYFGYDAAKAWVESPAGPRVAAKGLGKAIKVEGKFAPIHLEGWTIVTDSFTSVGWPGEAIGALDVYNIRGHFDPSAIYKRAWRISSIQVDRAVIRLDKPNNALKRPDPPKKPKPWYAIFLPNRFECGPITCPNSDLVFAFDGKESHIRGANVVATLIDKNMKYEATGGVLDFTYLPPMRIEKLDMFVTRPFITVYTAQLAGVDPNDDSRVVLSGQIGQHADKSIDAKLQVTDLPLDQVFPEDLRALIQCRVTGNMTYKRDTTGQEIVSEGDFQLLGANIRSLSMFRELAQLHENPDLQDFAFDEASCHFHLEHGILHLDIRLKCAGKFTMVGTVDYEKKTKMATLDVNFTDLPLKTWLPPEFKPRYDGVAKASMKWHGQLNTVKDSTADVEINFDGTHISNPILLRRLLSKKKLRTPEEINLQRANFHLTYNDGTFNLVRGELNSPEVLDAVLTGSLSPDHKLNASVEWTGLTIDEWLPPDMADQFSGDITGKANFEVTKWKMKDGSYGGTIKLLKGELRYTAFQCLLGRFVDDRSLLTMPITQAEFSWSWANGGLQVKDIDVLVKGKMGVKGNFAVNADKELSGTLWVGTKPDYIKSLSSVGTIVFAKKEDDLIWAKVKLSGTIKKPKQDLGSQIVDQLHRHPGVVLGLGAKLASWYIGDLFGASDDWARPDSTPEKATDKSIKAKASQ